MGKYKPIAAVCDYCGTDFLYQYGPAGYKRAKKHYCSDCVEEVGMGLRNYQHGYARHDENDRKDIRYTIWEGAKGRAKIKNIPFGIEIEDVVVPDFCPVLGIPISRQEGKSNSHSPSLDRIIPELGYIPGNVMVISHKANTMKSNATWDEISRFYNFYKKYFEVIKNGHQ